ncbi:ATP-binding cassette domain-containing protein [Tropheryma whipplei]|uniref:ABC transporter ATP-binding protein n=2 Tax=Tropheryma whipplei TaxID=2039 RepID=Q83GS1_TROWT|nr:ATP-binding cassette domain-containing protein [Tropheryma whipplei]AAO44272.1 ABC transporter ATP-binding protein [Tropheryma whipplei str. Twist]MCO8182939.1 ATP-binding cassette domain-containing protein [Tropheryma whipplei]CAD67260.1 ABC transporter ATP-binding protein [Tropheryma whipplei TW08/27]
MDLGMNSTTLLECKGVYKSYGRGSFTLTDASFQILPGQIVRLSGRSGGGKSTLLRIAGLLSTPDKGEVRVLGQTALSWVTRDRLRRKHIGILFQEGNLLGHLTLRDNLRYSCFAPPAVYEELVERLDLTDALNTKAVKLSGGELQRAGICRALVNQPQVVLLDEPTSSLDDFSTDTVVSIIRELKASGMGILIVSHDNRLDGLEDQRFLVSSGQIQELAP